MNTLGEVFIDLQFPHHTLRSKSKIEDLKFQKLFQAISNTYLNLYLNF